MTLNELKAEVAALGFDTDTESSDIMLGAARRAIGTIYSERGVYNTIELYRSPKQINEKIDVYFHTGGSIREFDTSSKAYSFKVSGNGSYSVSDALGVNSFVFSGSGSVFRGFIIGGGKLTFSGEYSYTVYDLSFFNEINSSAVSDIPVIGSFYEYKMSTTAHDFSAFVSLPTDAQGKEIQGAEMLGDILRIPEHYYGKIILTYKCKPMPISGNLDEEIYVPSGCEHVLPLLCAAYVWLDDDPEKAQYYMNLYREGIAALKIYSRSSVGGSYKDVMGWA